MGKKILLADDSITIQKVIELTFSDEDFEVVTVGNGRLADREGAGGAPGRRALRRHHAREGRLRGLRLHQEVAAALAQIPVLLLTGAFEPFDQERAARVGCDGFLAKPFEPETLIAKVKDLLRKAAARQSRRLRRRGSPPRRSMAAPARSTRSLGRALAPPTLAPPP